MHHAGSDDLESRLLEAAVDLTNQVLLNAVGLNNGKSAFDRHGNLVLLNLAKAARASIFGK
jgi:hypothetical protein